MNIKDNILIPVTFVENIGQEGKNSEVFRAIENNIKRELVIKKINRSKLRDGYFQEALYLYESKHPNIVEISYAGESACKNFVFLAMPFYKNGSLNSKIIKDKKSLTNELIIRYSLNFLSGLHSIHQKKLIHLDIKPDNILITDHNEAILSDFGLVESVKASDLYKDKKSLFMMLIPPENISLENGEIKTKSSYSKLTDIYQVGVTLYSLVNLIELDNYTRVKGIKDLGTLIKNITNGTLYCKNSYNNNVPIELQKIINKCLSINPANRYKSVQDILNDLGDLNKDIL